MQVIQVSFQAGQNPDRSERDPRPSQMQLLSQEVQHSGTPSETRRHESHEIEALQMHTL